MRKLCCRIFKTIAYFSRCGRIMKLWDNLCLNEIAEAWKKAIKEGKVKTVESLDELLNFQFP